MLWRNRADRCTALLISLYCSSGISLPAGHVHVKLEVRAMTEWKSYEEVARYLLDRFADEFGLGRVEGKRSGPP